MYMDFSKYLKILIHTADGVPSLNGGVRIVVTGSLTMSEGACQKFKQSFFLAPIEGGNFVQSDILRIMPETSPPVVSQARNQQNEIKQYVGFIAEPREVERVRTDHVSAENKVGDLAVPNPTDNGIADENCDDIDPFLQVTKEDLNGALVVASPPTQTHQPQKDNTRRSYTSSVTSLFSRLLNMRG